MIRLRMLVLCLAGLAPLPVLAASIPITTTFDVMADDDVCSLREAVRASDTAFRLIAREAGEVRVNEGIKTLDERLLEMHEDETGNETYSSTTALNLIDNLLKELNELDNRTTADDALLSRLEKFRPRVVALGKSLGVRDLNETTPPSYPDTLLRQPGFYTYSDGNVGTLQTATVDDPDNSPAGPITYSENDRFMWDGTHWTRFAAGQPVPLDLDIVMAEELSGLAEETIAVLEREIDRLETIARDDGCSDGSAFDIVTLEGEKTYYLNSPLDLYVRLTIRGAGDDSVIARCVLAADCGGVPVSATPHRLIEVRDAIALELGGLKLYNGDAGAGNGGAVEVKGSLALYDVTIEGNRAANGGGIYLDSSSSLTMNQADFLDNHAVNGHGGAVASGEGAIQAIEVNFGGYRATALPAPPGFVALGNTATGNGGAVAFLPLSSGALEHQGGAYVENEAQRGSAVSFDSGAADVLIENVTIARNHARDRAALNIALPAQQSGGFAINNLTMIENTAATGTAGLLLEEMQRVSLYNSLVAGNQDQSGGRSPDCDFGGGSRVYNQDDFRRNYYSPPAAAASAADECPGLRFVAGAPGVPTLENFVLGSAPLIDDGTDSGLVRDMDPAAGLYYVPVYPDDVNDSAENRLVNRGGSALDISRCADKDQRTFDRNSPVDEQCDIGAVEYQVGRRRDDTIELSIGQSLCLNVIANDIGDAQYEPGTLDVLRVERAGHSAIVVSRTPGSGNSHPTLDMDTVCTNIADFPANMPDAILMIPAPGFQGETDVLYTARWRTSGSAPSTGDFTGIAHIRTERRSGITSSSLGGLAPFLVALLGLLGLRRTRVRGMPLWLGLGWLLLSGPVRAENIIYVTTPADVSVAGDRECSLREALDVARNDRANSTLGDCRNGNEGPDVIEFEEGLASVTLRAPVTAYGGITLRCPLPEDPEALAAQCRIMRDSTMAEGFRLIESLGSLILSRMTLEGGRVDDDDRLSGGAILSFGNLVVEQSVFINNSALNGGAIFLAGASSSLTVKSSLFIGNTSRSGVSTDAAGDVVGMTTGDRATRCPGLALRSNVLNGVVGGGSGGSGGGGAIASTGADAHTIYIQSTSFIDNCSGAGSAALDLNSRSQMVVVNSTFTGNTSLHGPGALDVSGAQGPVMLRNLTIVDNRSGVATVFETWDVQDGLGMFQRSALETGTAGVTLTSSVLAANTTEADRNVMANCPMQTGMTQSANLFGAEFATRVGSCQRFAGPSRLEPSLGVYDSVAANDGDPATLSGMLSELRDIEFNRVNLRLHLPLSNSIGIVIDAGFENPAGETPADSLTDPLSAATLNCANVDARGASRTSGGRCDIGAYEVLQITAQDDIASNVGRYDRYVLIDLLINDLFDDGAPDTLIKQDCTHTRELPDTPATGETTYQFADDNDDICVEVIVPDTEDGVVRFLRKGHPPDADMLGKLIPKSDYVLMYDNLNRLRSSDLKVGPIGLRYRIYTVGQVVSTSAALTISVHNVPPILVPDKVVTSGGVPVSIDVLANDLDHDDYTNRGLKLLSVTAEGCKEGPVDASGTTLYWACPLGQIRLGGGGVVIWSPTSSYNPFNQVITYEVSDQDPTSQRINKSSFTILADPPQANGGGLLGDDDLGDMLGLDFLGAPGPAFFLPLLLGLFRRRSR